MILKYKTFIIFCLIGIINNILNYGFFLISLAVLNIKYSLAGIIGYLAGGISGYFLNRNLTFNSVISHKKSLFPYIMVQTISLLINLVMQYVSVAIIGIKEELSQLPSILITMILNYYLSKKYVFKG